MMNKKTFKFEISFNLNLAKDERLATDSIRAFQTQLHNFIQDWNGNNGYFYTYGSVYGDRDIDPTAVKVKKIAVK